MGARLTTVEEIIDAQIDRAAQASRRFGPDSAMARGILDRAIRWDEMRLTDRAKVIGEIRDYQGSTVA